MSFKHSPLIHVTQNIPDEAWLTMYVKDIIKKPFGIDGEERYYAHLWAKCSDGSDIYHGIYMVSVNSDSDISGSEDEIQLLPEFNPLTN